MSDDYTSECAALLEALAEKMPERFSVTLIARDTATDDRSRDVVLTNDDLTEAGKSARARQRLARARQAPKVTPKRQRNADTGFDPRD